MFSTCHYWSRTPPGRGGWMKKSDKWSSMQVTMKAENTKWRQFGTARSIQESQNQVIYQISTIWSHRKDIQRKKIYGSQLQQSSTSESSSARSTRIILTSKPQLLLLLTPHHRWLDRQSSSRSFPNKSEDNQPKALTNKLKRTQLRLIFIMFLDEFGYLPHSTSSAALHVTARDSTWLPANFHQNIYLLTFKFHTWIDFLGLVSLSHKASVFLLSFQWVKRFFINWSLSGFPLQFPMGWEVFYQQHDFLRLISFPMRLRYSHWSLGFPSQSPNRLGGFSPSYIYTYTHILNGAHV